MALFGEKGACAGCWCMYWRQKHSEFARLKGSGNRSALRRLVSSGDEPGLIAYAGGRPIGWCAIAPREKYIRLEGSRVLAPIDENPVWSIVCFFVAKPYRRSGVTPALIEAAVAFARKRGARIVEGYPVEPGGGAVPDVFAWTGFASSFRKAGFKEALRRSPTRPIMRRVLIAGPNRSSRPIRGAPAEPQKTVEIQNTGRKAVCDRSGRKWCLSLCN